MKNLYFFREENNFDDILKDVTVKKLIKEKTTFYQHLIIAIPDNTHEHVLSYITLKYGDSLCPDLVKDYTPIPNVDYKPIRK